MGGWQRSNGTYLAVVLALSLREPGILARPLVGENASKYRGLKRSAYDERGKKEHSFSVLLCDFPSFVLST